MYNQFFEYYYIAYTSYHSIQIELTISTILSSVHYQSSILSKLLTPKFLDYNNFNAVIFSS